MALDCLSVWAKTWQMDIAFTKCSVISYGNRKIVPKYYIDGHLLPYVDTVTDLGDRLN